MKSRYIPIVLTLLALISASLACAFGGELGLTNPRTAFDEPGENPTTVYSPDDVFYAVADLENATKGTVVSAKWFAVDVPGYDAGLIGESTWTVTEDYFSGYVSFQLTGETPWPAGSYQVEMYLNGVLTHTLDFAVE